MLFDVKGFGSDNYESFESKEPEKEVFKPNDFDKSITQDVNPLVKYEVINKKFNMGKLLKGAGCDISNGIMYCPFHPDALTGKPSAKYHADTDLLYCFSESKMYSAYHALKILYGRDMNQIFKSVWSEMSKEDRDDILSKYDDSIKVEESDKEEELWNKYIPILNNFKEGNINYTQFKNGLYKTFSMITEELGNEQRTDDN